MLKCKDVSSLCRHLDHAVISFYINFIWSDLLHFASVTFEL